MARYRKIDLRLWSDEKFLALSRAQPNAQTLWLRLLAGDHTGIIPGLSRVGEAALAEQLGWPVDDFRQRFAEIASRGMALADWPNRLLWLPNAIRYNEPDNPNVVKSWRTTWDEVPECELKIHAWGVLASHMRARDAARAAAAKEEAKPEPPQAFMPTFQKACPRPSAKLSRRAEPASPEPLREGSTVPGTVSGFPDGMANKEQEPEPELEHAQRGLSRACVRADAGACEPPEAPAGVSTVPGSWTRIHESLHERLPGDLLARLDGDLVDGVLVVRAPDTTRRDAVDGYAAVIAAAARAVLGGAVEVRIEADDQGQRAAAGAAA
jgi:hypothetical protein